MAKPSFRYPLSTIESDSDYLRIRVVNYIPPNIGGEDNTPFFTVPSAQKVIEAANRNGETNLLGTIVLPIPENIADQNSVKWEADQLNPIAAAAFGAIRDGVQGLDFEQLTKDPLLTASSALGALEGRAKAAYEDLDSNTRQILRDRLIASAVNIFNANINPNTFVSRTTGQILNPNLELLFQGVNLRNFDFNFTFTPRNAAESLQVKNIINTFKKRMAAKTSTQAGSSQSSGIFIKAPDVFDMEFRKGGRKHPFLFSMKPCGLKSCVVNYVSAGPYISYNDGTPVKIQMNLRFTELSPVYAEDYNSVTLDEGVGF